MLAYLLLTLALGSEGSLVNPGFEERSEGDEAVPGWTVEMGAFNGAKQPESHLELDRKEKRKGKVSLHLSGDRDTRAWKLAKQAVPVRLGGSYRLEAQVKTEGVEPNGFGLDNCYVGLVFLDGAGKTVGRQFGFPDRPDQSWRTLRVETVAPAQARAGYVYIFLSMIGDLWVDEVELSIEGGEPLPEPEVVFAEDFSKLRKLPRDWYKEVGATTGDGMTESKVEVDRKAQALLFEGEAGTGKWWIVGPEEEAEAGAVYQLEARVRGEDIRQENGQFGNLHLSLDFQDRSGQSLGKAVFASADPAETQWQPLSVQAMAPAETETVRGRMFFSMSGKAWFDDLVLSRLPEAPKPYANWESVEVEGIVLRYGPDHPQASGMKGYAQRLKQAKQEVCRQLEVEFPETITVWIYKDLEEGRLLTGGNLDFANPQRREVHQRWNSFIAHEMVHVIAHTRLEYSGTTLLGEGIAVWLNGQSPAAHHGRAAALLEQGELPSMADLLGRFRELGQGYPAAGSFCGYLLDTFGLETFKRIYPSKDPSADLVQLEGKSFAGLESGWHEELEKFR